MSAEHNRKETSTLREYVDSLLVTVILALFATTFILQAFKIPSSSMEETLLVGDHLLVNKFAFAEAPGSGRGWLPYREVRRGDIIVFKYPFAPHQHFVKRVVGLPGDRLKITDRRVFINGRMLPEPYKVHRSESSGRFGDNFPTRSYLSYSTNEKWDVQLEQWTQDDELLLPPGKFFVLGDNRDNSQDSRYWGFVDRENIIGRPLLIYWSSHPRRHRGRGRETTFWEAFLQFFPQPRWHRLFEPVR